MQIAVKILSIKIAIVVALAFAVLVVVAPKIVSAQDIKPGVCSGANVSLSSDAGACNEPDVCTGSGANRKCSPASEARVNRLITTIVNLISVVVGILAVIFIIIGGAKFITSGGDSGKVSSAKSSVIYAIVGLIIVALAQFIVRFVLSKT